MLENTLERMIRQALREDIGGGDCTTNCLISPHQVSRAIIIVREDAVICGLEISKRVFQQLDPKIKFHSSYKDGDRIRRNAKVLSLQGNTRAILTAERVALNFLSYLSAIATKTNAFVKKVHPYKTKIMDTRKTTPGLRFLERLAVRCGGGSNHRSNLNEMIFIKDNHHMAYQGKMTLHDAAARAKKRGGLVEVEIDHLKDLRPALKSAADIILLDNMNLCQIKKALAMIRDYPSQPKPEIEVSGRINLKNVRALARLGVERISVGALTHTRKAIDFSLELVDSI